MDGHPAITGQFARLFRPALSIAAVLPLNGARRPFADHLYGQFAMRILRKTDLKLRLALRVVVLSACCFAAAAAYVLFETDRAARSNADWIVDIVARNLQIQQDRIHWGK